MTILFLYQLYKYIHIFLTLQEGQTAAELSSEAGYDYIAKFLETTQDSANANAQAEASAAKEVAEECTTKLQELENNETNA